MNEQWKNIPDIAGYEVSNYGNIRNSKTKKMLSNSADPDGYLYVTMYNKPKYIRRSVHTLVAKAFIPNSEKKPTVNHIDKNKKNNLLSNLEWATYAEQTNHRIKLDGVPNIKGTYIWKCNIDTGEKFEHFTSIKEALKSVGEIHTNQTAKIVNHMNDAYGFRWYIEDQIDNEEWRDIPINITLVEGYKASTKGRIKNPLGKILNGYKSQKGYISVKVKNTLFAVHRIVAATFLSNNIDGMVINHKDGDKANNIIENLEIVTQKENISHSYLTGLSTRNNKVQIIQVDEIGSIVAKFDSMTEAESKTNINRGNIHKGINSKSTIKGYRWFSNINEYEHEVSNGEIKKNFFKVIQCDKNGNILQKFNKYPEAASVTDITVANICNSCNSKTRLAGGFKWFNNMHDYEQYFKQ
jgi:hypothetical protein